MILTKNWGLSSVTLKHWWTFWGQSISREIWVFVPKAWLRAKPGNHKGSAMVTYIYHISACSYQWLQISSHWKNRQRWSFQTWSWGSIVINQRIAMSFWELIRVATLRRQTYGATCFGGEFWWSCLNSTGKNQASRKLLASNVSPRVIVLEQESHAWKNVLSEHVRNNGTNPEYCRCYAAHCTPACEHYHSPFL